MNKESLNPFGIKISTQENISFPEAIDANLLTTLLKEHPLVLLRNFAPLDKNDLVSYAKTLGPLLEWEFGNVMEMRAQQEPKNYLFTHGHVPFHWDGAFHQVPRYLLFQCIEAPLENCGGETLFTNTHTIWETANISEKEEWQSLNLTYQTEKLAHYGGRITQSLVQTHPETNKTILRFAEPVPSNMLNPVSLQIEGYDTTQTEQLIDKITQRIYSSNHCYTHTWQKNDFLIADNHALIHGRNAFKQFSPRHLRRIQVL
jgi:alpha-ketoglutarate-dependent taurine dioxygenase